MDEKFIAPTLKKDGKKQLIKNLQSQRKEKSQSKVNDKHATTIQSLFRSFVATKKMKNMIQDRLQKRLSDLVQVEKAMKDQEFVLPITIMNDFMRDFNYLCFRFVLKNKYCDKNLEKFNIYQTILEKMAYWMNKSLITKKQKENIYQAFFNCELHQSQVRSDLKDESVKNSLMSIKQKNSEQNQIQNRSWINIAKMLQYVFRFFSASSHYTWKDNMQIFLKQFFNIQIIENELNCKSDPNVVHVLSFYDGIFINFNLYQLLNFQITQMVNRNSPSVKVEDMIEIGLFPIQIYQNLSFSKIISREQKEKSFNTYVKFQSEFITKIVSISKIAPYVINVEQRTSKTIPHLNWKNLFQSFLFTNVQDPLSQSGEKEFARHFQNQQTQLIHMFGNQVKILESILNNQLNQNQEQQNQQQMDLNSQQPKAKQQINFHFHDYYFFLKLMSYCLNFLTPQWFSNILVNYSLDDKDVIALSEYINILFDKKFALKIFSLAFDQNFLVNEDLNITTKERKLKYDVYNPEVSNIICEIYSKILSIASKSEQSQKLTFKIVSSFASNEKLIKRLYTHLLTNFQGVDSLTDGELTQETFNSYAHVYTIFIVSYYNQLSITDFSDFFQNKTSIPLDQLPGLIKALVKLNYKILTQNASQSSLIYLSFQSSKLLRVLHEFHTKKQIMPDNQWLLKDSQISGIIMEVQKFNFSQTSIIKAMPFCIPFETRIFILKKLIEKQKFHNDVAFKVLIRRNNIFGDGFEAFRQIREIDLQAKLRVYYIDEFGNEEKGIDAGGIFKEFINDLSKIVFDPNYGMFRLVENNQKLCPNQDSLEFLGPEHLEIFHFLGSVVGRAIYDQIQIQPIFSVFFLRQMIGKQNNLVELENFDKELYKNLKFLKEYKGDTKDLCLTFSIGDQNQREISLVPNGKNIPVDNSNILRYIYLVADYKMNKCIENQTKAFMNGLTKVIPKNWLQMFNENEVQMLISGQEKGIDIEDLKSNTKYEGGYGSWDFYIRDFWKLIASLTEEEKILLIKFVTSCERPPLLGFQNLEPSFTIVKVSSEGDTKLPSAQTCFNKFILPKYSSTKILKEKLLLALKAGLGFYLS
ncbi:hypothetical protein ABPG72_008435 [Tetrahymena utriculariae]